MVRGSNISMGRFSTPVQTGPGEHPDSCTVCTGSLFRGYRGVAHAPSPSVEVKESVKLHPHSTTGPSCSSLWWILFYLMSTKLFIPVIPTTSRRESMSNLIRWLSLCRGITDIGRDNHTKHMNVLCEKSARSWSLELIGISLSLGSKQIRRYSCCECTKLINQSL